ncbi:biotin-dependent carboxyltransferase family protein [Mangrovicoccus sp. HB161399]|uniref:5-oxoprolinase subunit C family protein n=1 Tax=Mangrovicoccus sp. HB161399 TaxID=2720392 RepID=UPI0015538F52|nr:biotin-dependent carboxyltransferase family protein [Mangrovicoccus sp. HB161399]
MSLTVLSPGPLATVQDAGRGGLRHQGVSAAGPMDPPAFMLANALAGNDPAAAAIEFAGFGGSFRAETDCRIAVTGGRIDLALPGQKGVAGQAYRLRAGEEVRIGAVGGATWGYLAVSGGIAIAPALGSRATHLRSGLGGLDGRALQAGDVLPLGAFDPFDPCLAPAVSAPDDKEGPAEIRVVPGPQDDRFSAATLARFAAEEFTVTPQRDRMAMVLGGPVLAAEGGHDIVSDGTVPGSVQVPGSGRPLVLMAEAQTTGGYPKIATVIGADLPRLAQLPTGSRFRFVPVARDAAEEIWIDSRRRLRARLEALRPKPEGTLSSHYLLSCDLVGGIWPPEEVVWQS